MGWEHRGAGRNTYYYKKARTAEGRVMSTYVGSGLLATLTAEIDAASRAYATYRELALKTFAADADAADAATRAYTAVVRDELAEALEREGFRYHRGEWRRPHRSNAAQRSNNDSGPAPAAAQEPADDAKRGRRAEQHANQQNTDARQQHAGSNGEHVPREEAQKRDRLVIKPVERALRRASCEALQEDEEEAYQLPPDPSTTRPDAGGLYNEPLVRSALSDAWVLRVSAERAVWNGEGDENHPALVRAREALATLSARWEHVPERPAPEPQTPASGIDLPAPRSQSEAAKALTAARSVVRVLERGDAAARIALLRHVHAIRCALGSMSVAPIGRAVIDQFALADAHAEAVAACTDAFAAWVECPAASDPAAQAFAALTQTAMQLGASVLNAEGGHANAVDVVLEHGGPVASGGDGTATDNNKAALLAAWKRRSERAERGRRHAERLLRHARKVGWIETPHSEQQQSQKRGSEVGPQILSDEDLAVDPLAVLAAPPPPPTRPPLRGEAARAAAEARAAIDAARAAWPPPHRIRNEALLDPDCPWNPFDYLPEFAEERAGLEPDASLGIDADDEEWLTSDDAFSVLVEEPATPDEMLADLARWAPEYAYS